MAAVFETHTSPSLMVPQKCAMAESYPAPSVVGQGLTARVAHLHAIRALAAESDVHHDRYADTGCLAALADAHRVDAQLEKLLGE